MTLKQKYGPTALVAGASEGLGAAFATYLASEGMDVILAARRREPLQKLASTLENKYKVSAGFITCDMTELNATDQVQQQLGDKEINLLVYNVGLSYIGRFEQNSIDNHQKIACSNMLTPLTMLHVFGDAMLKKGHGAIIMMGSLAGFQGSGFLSVYAATKAFNRTLAEGLWYEWKYRGVDVIACCAGATSTPNFMNTKPGDAGFFAPRIQTPEEVVEECFKHLGKCPSFISGTGNKIASFIMQKILTRKMAINIMGDTTRKIYSHYLHD